MNSSETLWKFSGHCFDGETFLIEEVNVWSRHWEAVPDETAEIKDPLYHQDFIFPVYYLTEGNKQIKFAAGEFSNQVWGFYIPG